MEYKNFIDIVPQEQPVTLIRTYENAIFDDVAGIGNITDNYRLFPVRLKKDCFLDVNIRKSRFGKPYTLIERKHLEKGEYCFSVTYQDVLSKLGPIHTFIIELRGSINAEDPLKVIQRINGVRASCISGHMLGQIMLGSINIDCGRVDISKADLIYEGRGPDFVYRRK